MPLSLLDVSPSLLDVSPSLSVVSPSLSVVSPSLSVVSPSLSDGVSPSLSDDVSSSAALVSELDFFLLHGPFAAARVPLVWTGMLWCPLTSVSMCVSEQMNAAPQSSLFGVRMEAVLLLALLLCALPGQSGAQAGSSLLDLTQGLSSFLPRLSRPANHSRIRYAVMFDAGSTGTRIHVYTFIQSHTETLPILDNEMFQSIKPGLSAYSDSPEMAGHMVRMLLKVAKRTVPRVEWKRTPAVLRATAGLRLLPKQKAYALLEQVKHVFEESPFLVPDNSVSIMDGTSEGILAWISLNFLTDHLSPQSRKTVGILDLGGGSTQITFLPNLRKTIASVPSADYVSRLDIFNSSFELYTYSYLGNGLMAARLATLGALGAKGLDWQIFKSSCLPKKFRDEWSFGGLTYQVSGHPDGTSGYKRCYEEVLQVVKGVVHRPLELQHTFYAFSYYFERAADAGLIDGEHGGSLEVRDFRRRAKEICNKKSPGSDPFLCLDLTYITALLTDGFGFTETTVLQLTKKVKNVEASWTLGAVLDQFHILKIH